MPTPATPSKSSKSEAEREEDVVLFRQYGKTKVFNEDGKITGSDEVLRNKLANRNCKLVTYVVNKFYNKKKEHKALREDLLQEGSLGLLSAIDGFNPELGFRFSTYACVPLTTQILTQRGWKFHHEIQDDDRTLGYNKQGKSEWTLIQGVTTYEDAPLMRFGDSLWNAVCTPQHKWLMSRNGQVELTPLTGWPQSSETHNKRSAVELITAAPYVGGNCSLTPDEAAVLAWILSDGSLYGGRHNPKGAVIVQSTKKFVHEIRSLLKRLNAYSSDTKRENDCLGFNVKASVFRRIWNKSKLETRSISDLVLDLTVTARSSWFEAWRQAEGTKGRRTITQNKGEKLDALVLCAFLEGHSGVHSSYKSDTCSLVSWHMRNRTPRRCVVVPAGHGPVWCPKTELGSWTARTENGFVFLTGNTWWIKQSISNYLLSQDPRLHVPSHIRTAQNKVLKKMKELKMDFHDLIEENAETLGITDKMLESINASLKSKWVYSMEEPASTGDSGGDGGKVTLKDLLVDENAAQSESLTDYTTLIAIVKEGLASLTERERNIILLRYDVITEEDVVNSDE
jgi:DNA-directed RNA polymerase sigma subunit (sigma70/sigma32)